MMDDLQLIKVLWVEDDPTVTVTYLVEAEGFGLELVPRSCWDDAKTLLQDNFEEWTAIILDAKCKHHRDSADNAVRFLGEALKDIKGECEKQNRTIPWYILTGGSETEVSDSINEDRLAWDKDWTDKENKTYYSKNTDRQELFKRIKEHASVSPRLQIKHLYADIYDKLDCLKEVREKIVDILAAMHFPNLYKDFDPKLYFNPLRKGLEYVFRELNSVKILSDDFFPKDQVNLNQCLMFIQGKNAEITGFKSKKGEIASVLITNMMWLILELGNVNSHTTKPVETEINDSEQQILITGMNPKYLIFSLALQLGEIVLWAKEYIDNNSDKDENLNNHIQIKGRVEKDENGIYHVNNFLVSKQKVVDENLLGKIVIIKSSKMNIDNRTKSKYPYYTLEST